MATKKPEAELATFIAKYTPEIAARAREVLAEMRTIVPGAIELVYDNYNALGVGFSANEKASGVVFSIVLYPRWINLFFFGAAGFPDPKKLLIGTGSSVRHIVLADGVQTLREPAVKALMRHGLMVADPPIDPKAKGYTVIKAVSENQRPRRPPVKVAAEKLLATSTSKKSTQSLAAKKSASSAAAKKRAPTASAANAARRSKPKG